MKKIIIFPLVLLTLNGSLIYSEESVDEVKAEKKISKVNYIVDLVLQPENILRLLPESYRNTLTEDQFKRMLELVAKDFATTETRSNLVLAYEKGLSTDELEVLKTFFESDLGKKFLDILPEASIATSQLVNAVVQRAATVLDYEAKKEFIDIVLENTFDFNKILETEIFSQDMQEYKQVVTEAKTDILSQVTREEFRNSLRKIYSDNFTLEEIKNLAQVCNSEALKKHYQLLVQVASEIKKVYRNNYTERTKKLQSTENNK